MSFHVNFSIRAQRQLREIEQYITRAGSPASAARFVDAVVDYCDGLQTFPHRGTRHDEIHPGLRIIGFR
ncbi:MAG: type II toxin-antitoxin system RelE/ParE family toxin, partial [Pseudomonadales bacterium]|nr:type II toxin-antitoxin system RelE/ParE family toxin [Pseudomonadales bacterium]